MSEGFISIQQMYDAWDTVAQAVSGGKMNTDDAAVKAAVEAVKAAVEAVKAAVEAVEAEIQAINSTEGIKKIADAVKVTADDNTIAGLGALAAAAVTDPASSASVIALLKGMLKQLQGTGTGAAPVQLTGSKVVEEVVVNAQSVDAGEHVEFSMAPTNEDEIWIMVSIDKQPWILTTSTQVYSGSDGTPDTLYPRRLDVTNTFTGVAPATSLFMGGIIYSSAAGYSPPSDVREAKARIVPYKSNAKGRIRNKSTETATITVRLLRIWRKS